MRILPPFPPRYIHEYSYPQLTGSLSEATVLRGYPRAPFSIYLLTLPLEILNHLCLNKFSFYQEVISLTQI